MKYKAFTMLEVVVVMGVLVAVALISLPLTYSSVVQSNAEGFMRDLNSRSFSQQQLAYTGTGGDDFGIAFETDEVIYFTGPNLLGATNTIEQSLPPGLELDTINLTGVNDEIVFDSQSFRPDETGYVDYTDTGFTHRIQFNEEGLIEYLKFPL